MGNRRSVEKALEHVGARAARQLATTQRCARPRARRARRRRLPARDGRTCASSGLDELLRERVAAGTPVLGICLGMQLAFELLRASSAAREGLGIVAGEVRALDAGGLKLPHIGWNEVALHAPGSPLLAGLPERCAFYHVHSFAPVPATTRDVLGTAEYGERVRHRRRSAAPSTACSSTPRSPPPPGLRLLANFARICARGARRPRRRR